jgi:hypothetical protein
MMIRMKRKRQNQISLKVQNLMLMECCLALWDLLLTSIFVRISTTSLSWDLLRLGHITGPQTTCGKYWGLNRITASLWRVQGSKSST